MDLRSEVPEPAAPLPTALSWRVSPPLAWAKGIATVAFALVAIVYWEDRTQAFAALVGAVLLGIFAARDLIAPVRLAADREGVTVIDGFVGQRRLPWSAIERVGIDQRSRLGLRTEMLEIDAGDSLHLFSTYDLNAPCADVEESLRQLRPS